MFVVFMVTTRLQMHFRLWWGILLADFGFTAMVLTLFGGAERTWLVRILCSCPAVFANIFAFIDSPYTRRAAKKLSHWLTLKHGLELLLLPLALLLGEQAGMYL